MQAIQMQQSRPIWLWYKLASPQQPLPALTVNPLFQLVQATGQELTGLAGQQQHQAQLTTAVRNLHLGVDQMKDRVLRKDWSKEQIYSFKILKQKKGRRKKKEEKRKI